MYGASVRLTVTVDIGEEQAIAGAPPPIKLAGWECRFPAGIFLVQIKQECADALAALGDFLAIAGDRRVEIIDMFPELLTYGIAKYLWRLEKRERQAGRGGNSGADDLGEE